MSSTISAPVPVPYLEHLTTRFVSPAGPLALLFDGEGWATELREAALTEREPDDVH